MARDMSQYDIPDGPKGSAWLMTPRFLRTRNVWVPRWHEKYGEEAAISMKSIVCEGKPYNVAFFAPVWPLELTPSISEEQYQKRLGERLKKHRKISCP